ncbi:hypothetical protein GEV33_002762 [Tenebrio molitor]|uniref:Uncharacterized protein n=1 Tax=Tenebrio molitor TaxID=7067 RepID=A0A8J6LEK9_TENMO|nr:hypothetical protein GEV33_002762 [Tenebrio molitor]
MGFDDEKVGGSEWKNFTVKGNNEWDLIQINKVYEFETGSSSTAASHLVTKSFYCFGNKAVWNM